RRMDNLTKTNDQLFSDYYDLILNTHTSKSFYEAKRLLEQFRIFLGQVPPSVTLAVQFLTNFKSRKPNTRARYAHVLGAFFRWYNGEKLPIKIKAPKILPQYVPGEDIDRLIAEMKNKKSHKGNIERDILLVETARMTGLRRSELANLKVGDLHLDCDEPVLVVRGGKGEKDRAVGLNMYIKNKLAEFVIGKSPRDKVFGLKAKSISGKIRIWANKAGVPQLHTHSLRHYVGTTLFQRNANPRAIQTMMGHESLETTMRYAAVIGKDMKEIAKLLEKEPDKPVNHVNTDGIMPVVYSKEPKKPDKK
ncbi:tyrosine-type recombinase/integrase, partial [Chloroflexota bacterium]